MSEKNEVRTFPNESITPEQFLILKQSLEANIWSLIYISRNLIENEKQTIASEQGMDVPQLEVISIVSGLYTHAIEEYGKFLFVVELKSTKSGKYDLSRIKNEFFNHNAKIEKAIKNLPSECNDIGFDFEKEYTNPTLGTRLDVFHTGIHGDGNIRKLPLVSFEKLDIATQKFYEEYNKIKSRI